METDRKDFKTYYSHSLAPATHVLLGSLPINFLINLVGF